MRSVLSLPSGTRSQVPGRPKSTMAVELEIEQLTDAQPGAAQHGQPDAGEQVVEASATAAISAVSMSGASARGNEFGLLGDVAGEHQPSAGGCGQPQSVMSSKKPRRSTHA